jgi:hypothetical protein
MSTVLPEDNEPAPRNARSKVSDVSPGAPMDKMLAMSAAFPEDNKSVPPAPPTGASAPVAPPAPKPLARFKVILEEDAAIPPTGLFISANGRPYLLMAGVEAQVPQEVLSVLNDAVTSVPVIDPQTQRVTGYRSRLRFPYRRIE